MDIAEHLAELPQASRLALAYAPAAARSGVLALLALDARLAGIVRRAREPLLGQMQLAWWRDQLQREPAARPKGQPLLQLLVSLEGQADELVALVNGWEELLDPAAVDRRGLEALAEARGRGWAALARMLAGDGAADTAGHAGYQWALADLTAGLGQAEDRAAIAPLLAACDWNRVALPRSLRSLAILHGLACRARGTGPLLDGPGALAVAIRIGMLGR
jgi:phytoene synthase